MLSQIAFWWTVTILLGLLSIQYFPDSYQEGHSGEATYTAEYLALRCLVSCHQISIEPVKENTLFHDLNFEVIACEHFKN